MDNILTKIFKFNQATKELETTLLNKSIETWGVMFPSMESGAGYGRLLRVGKSFQSFTDKNEADLFYKSILAAYELTDNKNLGELVRDVWKKGDYVVLMHTKEEETAYIMGFEDGYRKTKETLSEEEINKFAREHSAQINNIPQDWFNTRRVRLLLETAFEEGYRKAKEIL